MLIMCFFAYKSLPNLLFGVLCLPGDQSHPFVQPTINPLGVASAGLVHWVARFFPPWEEGPNFESYKNSLLYTVGGTMRGLLGSWEYSLFLSVC